MPLIRSGDVAVAVALVVSLGAACASGADEADDVIVSGSSTSPADTGTVRVDPVPEAGDSDEPATATAEGTAATTSIAPTDADRTTSTTPAPQQRRVSAAALSGGRVLCAFHGEVVPESVLQLMRDDRAAGVLLFAENLEDQDRARQNARALREAASASRVGTPPIIAADQEGGIVARIPGPPNDSAQGMGSWPSEEIEREGAATGTALLDWGVNVDLAPVADVARPGSFIEAQRRSFGSDPDTASSGVAAFARGMRSAGVAATLKHFPGLGAATANTDDAVSVVGIDSDEIESVDLPPFAAGIDAGADLVMVSSAVYPAVDDQPALYSRIWIQEVLRTQLGFKGVIVSDALDTPALEPSGSIGERAVRAAVAGVDLFIASDPQACVDVQIALADAIRTGSLAGSTARASWDRVLALRVQLAK